MNFWAKLIEFASAEMPVPTAYGWFHLMFIGLCILAAAIIFFAAKGIVHVMHGLRMRLNKNAA